MFRNKKSEILWGLNLRTYMYGSTVVKRQDGSVQFYNPLVRRGVCPCIKADALRLLPRGWSRGFA